MKTLLFFFTFTLLVTTGIKAQVTQLNNNNSLRVTVPLSSTKTIVVSEIDSSIWVTDGTSLAGTIQISPDIKFEDTYALLSGKVIFRGSRPAEGSEIFISDGTIAGTILVKDVFAGTTASEPRDMVVLNGFVYFIAQTAAEGFELWRTDGTPGNTAIVKDINSGAPGAFDASPPINFTELFSNGSYLLFAANTPASGVEIWRSDGSAAGTVLLKEINPLAVSSNPNSFIQFNNLVLFKATDDTHGEEIWKTDGTGPGTELLKDINPLTDSSNAKSFFRYNNMLLFLATDADDGEEVWKTDGTDVGTVLVKDINPGPASSTSIEIVPGFPGIPIFISFHLFNNKVYFRATDGDSNGELWSSDGTEANTVLLKDIVPSSPSDFPLIYASFPFAINLPTKFIFPVSDGSSSELWESDGTTAGTKLFKSFNSTGDFPYILLSFGFDISTGNFTYPLFQGNKFFFVASTATNGRELWISNGVDGLVANTHIVKDIDAGAGDGIDFNSFAYLYTTTHLFFAADDGTNGNELWKSDGTDAGTEMVEDINPNAGDANTDFLLVLNGKVIFNATDGDDPDPEIFDLYVVDGTFTALPVTLTDFTVSLNAGDALLQWKTVQETNTKDFTVQRSYNGRDFENIGIVQALGTVSNRHSYSFKDAGIINSGKEVAYYRLVASDKDGKTKNTNVISLKLKGPGNWNVVIFSNPVRDNLRILLSGITARVKVSIMDVSGKTIYTNTLQNVNGQITLPAKLQPGVHVLTVETNNERKAIQFIKQ